MPLTPEELFTRLAQMGIDSETVFHPPLRTVADSQALRGTIAGAHTKNLFLRDRKDRHFLLTVEETAQVDLKTVHTLIGAASRVSFGKPEQLMDYLGVEPGAVTPFGAVNDAAGRVTIVLDATLVAQPVVNAHPLTNEATTSVAAGDLVRFLKETGHDPLILNVAAHSPH